MYAFVCDKMRLILGAEAARIAQIRPMVAVCHAVLFQCALRCKAPFADATLERFLAWWKGDNTLQSLQAETQNVYSHVWKRCFNYSLYFTSAAAVLTLAAQVHNFFHAMLFYLQSVLRFLPRVPLSTSWCYRCIASWGAPFFFSPASFRECMSLLVRFHLLFLYACPKKAIFLLIIWARSSLLVWSSSSMLLLVLFSVQLIRSNLR